MTQLRPIQIVALVGGALLLLSCFLEWAGEGRYSVGVMDSSFGFAGVFVLLISLALLGVGVVGAFLPQVKLPEQILGFTIDQAVVALAFAVTVYGFSITFLSVRGTNLAGAGAFLAWIGGSAMIAAVIMAQRAPAPAPSEDPPPPPPAG